MTGVPEVARPACDAGLRTKLGSLGRACCSQTNHIVIACNSALAAPDRSDPSCCVPQLNRLSCLLGIAVNVVFDKKVMDPQQMEWLQSTTVPLQNITLGDRVTFCHVLRERHPLSGTFPSVTDDQAALHRGWLQGVGNSWHARNRQEAWRYRDTLAQHACHRVGSSETGL